MPFLTVKFREGEFGQRACYDMFIYAERDAVIII